MDLDLSRFFCIIFILQSHQFIKYSFIFYKLSYLSFLVKNVVITTKKAGIKLHKKNNQFCVTIDNTKNEPRITTDIEIEFFRYLFILNLPYLKTNWKVL